jgi:hypothetical protein
MTHVDAELGEALAAVAGLTDCNPFTPQRVELEQRILGADFVPFGTAWAADADAGVFDPNLPRLRDRVEQIVGDAYARLAAGAAVSEALAAHYRRAVFYLLWLRTEDAWAGLIKTPPAERSAARRVDAYDRFAADAGQLCVPVGGAGLEIAHLFAIGFQARRAFHQIFRKIFGSSAPAARLRATVWESIFTSHPEHYRAGFYRHMAGIATLITGESGTGKELVARAIALSQYIPFDPATRSFAAEADDGFAPVNLTALSATLIESELFGHCRGSFTGAIADRVGWLQRCTPYGAVFLDEIGDLDAGIQVKLLRVLQHREFYRIGDSTPRRFAGKVIAATHQNLDARIAAGSFREDFYFRICADRIQMPTLREQLAASPEDLRRLLVIVARGIGAADEAPWLAANVERVVLESLGAAYAWPGNMRELEQCVRNVLVHGEYRPRLIPASDADGLAAAIRAGALSAEALLQRYVAVVYNTAGTLHEAARRLGLDSRTVRAKLGLK